MIKNYLDRKICLKKLRNKYRNLLKILKLQQPKNKLLKKNPLKKKKWKKKKRLNRIKVIFLLSNLKLVLFNPLFTIKKLKNHTILN